MPGFDGTGPGGMGPMTGGGRGFCGSFGVRAAWQPYGMRRWSSYAFPRYGAYGYRPFAQRMTREQELEFLQQQADALREELKEMDKEIGELSIREK